MKPVVGFHLLGSLRFEFRLVILHGFCRASRPVKIPMTPFLKGFLQEQTSHAGAGA